MPSARGVATSIWWRFRQLLLHCTTSRIHAVELQTPRLVSVVRLAAHGREWRLELSKAGGADGAAANACITPMSWMARLKRVFAVDVSRCPPGSLEAWDLMLKAQWSHAQFTAASFADARAMLLDALALDAGISMVHALISDIALWSLSMGWRQDAEEAPGESAKHASAALSLDPGNAHARACMWWVELFSGNVANAREAADTAIKTNPSYAVIRVYCGNMYVILGEAQLALEQYDVMRRLSPRDPLLFVADSWSALGHYVLENYEQTLEWCHRSLRQNKDFIYTLVTMLAAYGQLERKEEAQKCLQHLLTLVPEPSEQFVRMCYPFPEQALIERFLEGLNKAGVPL